MPATINRTERLSFRIREHERKALEDAAKLSRQRLSDFVREVLVSAAQRRLARAENSSPAA